MRTTKETDDPKVQKENIFYCKGEGLEAIGEYSAGGFVVYKGSQMSKTTSNSIHKYLITNRETLLKVKIVEEKDKAFFKKDHQFSSPSQATATVLGRNANEWKNIERFTLDQLKRKR